MMVSLLPQVLDICIKGYEYKIFWLYRLDYWIVKMRQKRIPSRHFRKNRPSTGSKEHLSSENIGIEESKSIKEVQRAFRKEFYQKKHRQVPIILAFTRIHKKGEKVQDGLGKDCRWMNPPCC